MRSISHRESYTYIIYNIILTVLTSEFVRHVDDLPRSYYIVCFFCLSDVDWWRFGKWVLDATVKKKRHTFAFACNEIKKDKKKALAIEINRRSHGSTNFLSIVAVRPTFFCYFLVAKTIRTLRRHTFVTLF